MEVFFTCEIGTNWNSLNGYFQGLCRLQSSLHISEQMGVINLSILYTSFVVSCLFLPKIFIQFCGYKWTVALSFIGYIIWAAANGWDTYLRRFHKDLHSSNVASKRKFIAKGVRGVKISQRTTEEDHINHLRYLWTWNYILLEGGSIYKWSQN